MCENDLCELSIRWLFKLKMSKALVRRSPYYYNTNPRLISLNMDAQWPHLFFMPFEMVNVGAIDSGCFSIAA